MKTILFTLIVFSSLLPAAYAQTDESGSLVKWYTVEEAMAANKLQKKPLFVDVYTDWCGWCKHMSKTTFANPYIANYLNQNYYPIRFDAETTDTVTYRGKTYTNNGTGTKPKHDLANELLDGRFSFPTLVFIDTSSVRSVIPGYLSVRDFEPVMYYFAEGINLSTPYEKFEGYFRATFSVNDTAAIEKIKNIDTTGIVQWHTFEEVMELCKTKPKKIYIHIDTDWRIGGKMMLKTTYGNKKIADYINQNYYAIYFNALSTNEVKAFGETFINEQKQHPFHNLAVAMLQGRMVFPATLILDEDQKLRNRMQEYLSPELIEPILMYFGSNEYTGKQWPVYLQTFNSKL